MDSRAGLDPGGEESAAKNLDLSSKSSSTLSDPSYLMVTPTSGDLGLSPMQPYLTQNHPPGGH